MYVHSFVDSSPTKVTLMGAVLFALQQTHYLPLQKQHLMLFYTIFLVVNKVSVIHLIPTSGIQASEEYAEEGDVSNNSYMTVYSVIIEENL